MAAIWTTGYLAPGTTPWFPVAVPGALFHLGDGHAFQGDGEITGTGIETSFEMEVTFQVLKRRIAWPRDDDLRYTTIYSRWNRWSGRRVGGRILDALIAAGRLDEIGQLDSSYVKAHRSAVGQKGGRKRRRSASAAAGAPPRSAPSATSSAGHSRSP